MTLDKYKPVLVKVLRDAKVQNAEALATIQINRMKTLDELLGDGVLLDVAPVPAGVGLLNQAGQLDNQPVTQVSATRFRQPQYPEIDASKAMLIGEPDIFKRVGSTSSKQPLTADQIMELKIRAMDDYKAKIPPVIECQPPGFDKPLILTCQGYQSGMESMPGFKIVYGPQGMGEAGNVEVWINIQEELPSALQVVTEIQNGAASKLFPKAFTSPTPMQQPPITLGALDQSFGGGQADDSRRPVEKFGDGFDSRAPKGPDGQLLGPSESQIFGQDDWGNLGKIAANKG